MGVLRRFPPISKNCVAHLATHFLPAVSERRSEWPTSDTRERSRAAVAPLGKGSDGGTRRGRRYCGDNLP